MKQDFRIASLYGMQILDSRGTPTLRACVTLEGGVEAWASVPSGASTGKFEACELRDGGEAYGGKGVLRAAGHIADPIAALLKGQDVRDQQEIDARMRAMDGTEQKSNLGANAMLAVSLACAHAAAAASGLALYRYLGGVHGVTLPVPMMNIFNGGEHAGNNVDIQEFMVMPVGAARFSEALRMGVEVYHALGRLLHARGLSTAVGDEGGYAPNVDNEEQALQLIVEAIEQAGLRPGQDVCIALDAATSDWLQQDRYVFPKKGSSMRAEELLQYFSYLADKYPIVSIEDPLAQDDFEGFAHATRQLGDAIQVVGDDLFVTNTDRLRCGIQAGSANAILIKPNQIGTLSETLEAVRVAVRHGYGTILSHRSGETEDTTIADIAVATNAGQIKTGAPARSERTCKYNRLLAIERMLGDAAIYPGRGILRGK
nr:phosphopyruvate hydratase [Maliibacterium massiliense]